MIHKSSLELEKDKTFIQKGIEVIDSTKGDSILPRMAKLASLIYPEIAEYAEYNEKTWHWLNIFMRMLEEKLVEFLSNGEDHLVPGARKLFELFGKYGRNKIPIIVTAGWVDLIYKQIEAVGFGDVVSTVVIGGVTVPGDKSFHFKDKTEAIVRCLAQRMSENKGDSNKIVVMIGDSPQDIIAAKKAAEELGYYVYSVGISKDPKRRLELIKAGADVLITDYEASFDQLLQWLQIEDINGIFPSQSRNQI